MLAMLSSDDCLLVLRRDSNPLISLPMRKAVSLKALKNKDRMSVETAIEVLGPEVQRAIPSGPVVVTLIPEVYTFWRQNRPGCIYTMPCRRDCL